MQYLKLYEEDSLYAIEYNCEGYDIDKFHFADWHSAWDYCYDFFINWFNKKPNIRQETIFTSLGARSEHIFEVN